MDNFKTSVNVDATITPEIMADLFCSMDQNEMAAFFNYVHEMSEQWEDFKLGTQMLYVARSGCLTTGGRMAMQTMGEFAIED